MAGQAPSAAVMARLTLSGVRRLVAFYQPILCADWLIKRDYRVNAISAALAALICVPGVDLDSHMLSPFLASLMRGNRYRRAPCQFDLPRAMKHGARRDSALPVL